MSNALQAADSLDYYLPEPHELQAAVRPIVTLHPEYDARQLRGIVKGAHTRTVVCERTGLSVRWCVSELV